MDLSTYLRLESVWHYSYLSFDVDFPGGFGETNLSVYLSPVISKLGIY